LLSLPIRFQAELPSHRTPGIIVARMSSSPGCLSIFLEAAMQIAGRDAFVKIIVDLIGKATHLRMLDTRGRCYKALLGVAANANLFIYGLA
jgi:hypothetical protein